MFYRVKIISGKVKKDRWDQLLEKTIHQHEEFDTEQFAFFDDGDDQVFMNGEKLVVVSDKVPYKGRDGDMLKQIYDKEFSPRIQHEETAKLIKKPPRKSLENRKSNASNYSSRNSMPTFDD